MGPMWFFNEDETTVYDEPGRSRPIYTGYGH